MKKEEILEKSRKENKNKDVYELEVCYKAGTLAAITMLILAFVYFCYDIYSGKGSNPAFYSLIMIYNSALSGFKAVKLEKNRIINTVSAFIWGILSIILVVLYFIK